MVLEAAEAHAVWWIAVVEAWITCFCTVEVAVEGSYLDSDFWDQITGQMRREGRWIIGGRVWEEARV